MSDGVTVRFKAAFGNKARGQPRVKEPLPAATVGQKEATELKPGATRAARMLALAHYIDRAIDKGRIESYAEAAAIIGVSRARMSQIMNLLNLLVATQEEILKGAPASERTLRAKTENTDLEILAK